MAKLICDVRSQNFIKFSNAKDQFLALAEDQNISDEMRQKFLKMAEICKRAIDANKCNILAGENVFAEIQQIM